MYVGIMGQIYIGDFRNTFKGYLLILPYISYSLSSILGDLISLPTFLSSLLNRALKILYNGLR
jgi:hypothetical protein